MVTFFWSGAACGERRFRSAPAVAEEFIMELIANKREILGKKVKSLRRQGLVPAVVFGKELGSIPLELNRNDFREAYRQVGENGLLHLKVVGQTYSVLLHELQIDPVTRELLHVDFFQVDLTKRVTVSIPLVVVGESPAVQSGTGLLLTLLTEVEAECLPTDIPAEIAVDISSLSEVGDSFTVDMLPINQNEITIALAGSEVVAKIVPATMEEEVEEAPSEEISEGVDEEAVLEEGTDGDSEESSKAEDGSEE